LYEASVKNDQVAAAAFLGCFFGFAGTSDFQRSYMFSGWEKTLNVLNVSQFATGIPTSSTKAAKSFCGATAFIGLVGQSYASGMCGIFYGCCHQFFALKYILFFGRRLRDLGIYNISNAFSAAA
jgi:hypothetical protein